MKKERWPAQLDPAGPRVLTTLGPHRDGFKRKAAEVRVVLGVLLQPAFARGLLFGGPLA